MFLYSAGSRVICMICMHLYAGETNLAIAEGVAATVQDGHDINELDLTNVIVTYLIYVLVLILSP